MWIVHFCWLDFYELIYRKILQPPEKCPQKGVQLLNLLVQYLPLAAYEHLPENLSLNKLKMQKFDS